MQFLDTVDARERQIKVYANNDLGSEVVVGRAWRAGDELVIRLDVYGETVSRLETYKGSDGGEFLSVYVFVSDLYPDGSPLVSIANPKFERSDSVIIGYARKRDRILRLNLVLEGLLERLAPTRRGDSVFLQVAMPNVTSIVFLDDLKVTSVRARKLRDPDVGFLINRDSFR